MEKYLERLIREKDKDQHKNEVYLSKKYAEFLLYPDIIEKIGIAQHYRILQMAIENDKYNEFPYDIFASFLINQLEKGYKNYNFLLTLVDVKKINREDLLKITKLTKDSSFKISDDYLLECLCTDKQETEKKFEAIANLINSSFNTLKEYLSNEINNIKQNLNDQRNDFLKNSNDIKSEISNVQNKQDLLKSEISHVENNIKSNLSEIMRNIKSEVSHIQNKQKLLKTEISSVEKNIKAEISAIIDNQEEFNNENKQFIQKQISDAQDKNKELLISTVNELNNKIKENHTESVDLILSKVKENKKSIDSQIKDVKNSIPIRFHYSSDFKSEKIYNFLMFKENLPLTFNCNENSCGLFEYFNLKIGNPFESRLFEIKGNSEKSYENVLKKICNSKYKMYETWISKDEKNSYIQIDFKKYSFCFKAIIYNCGQFGQNITGNIIIQGSNTGFTWNKIQRFICDENWYECSRCELDNFTKESYRYIKITMDGPNSSDNHRLCIRNLELYGILNECGKK